MHFSYEETCMHTFVDTLCLSHIWSVCIGPLFFSKKKKKNLFVKTMGSVCARIGAAAAVADANPGEMTR